jgi:hypothetical protein
LSASLQRFAAPPSAIDVGTAAGPTIEAYPGDETALLSTLVRMFEESEMASHDARNLAEKCRDYFDGRQYTAEEIAVLRKRRQPPIVNNYVKRKVEILRGLERRGRSDPKAYPRTPTEDNRADAATQALRFVADDQRYDVVRSSVFDNILIEGVGGVEVIVEPTRNAKRDAPPDYDIVINHIPWDRLFWDPHSRHPGFTDSRYMGVVIWTDREDLLDQYPGSEDILNATFESGASETYDDRPHQRWTDSKRRRVRIVQIWWKRRADWWSATITKGGFLEGPSISPYIDRHGNRSCALILRSAYCDRDLNRYGIVRDLISPQDSINKRESKLAHALNVNQTIMEAGAVDDADKARAEVAKPDGQIIVNRGFRFEIQKDTAEIAGHFQLLQHAVQQMNVTGPNASMAGKDPREQSGRAIIAQQSAGQMEHEPVADALRQHTHKVFEAVWQRIKQFKTAEWWVRVTDADKNIKFVGLNHPVTIADLLGNLDKTQPLMPQLEGLPPLDARAVQFGLTLQPGDPRLGMTVKIENDVGDIDVDIDIEEGPDSPSLAIEQFQMIMQLPPEILQQFPAEFIIKASSLRNKDDLVALLEQHQKAQAAAGNNKQALETANAQAEVDLKQASAADKRASATQRMHGMAVDHAVGVPGQEMDRLHGMAMDHAAASAAQQPPDNSMLPPEQPAVDPLAAQQQDHEQQMDRAKLALAAQQQGHSQAMDIAGHALNVQQAQQPPGGKT